MAESSGGSSSTPSILVRAGDLPGFLRGSGVRLGELSAAGGRVCAGDARAGTSGRSGPEGPSKAPNLRETRPGTVFVAIRAERQDIIAVKREIKPLYPRERT